MHHDTPRQFIPAAEALPAILAALPDHVDPTHFAFDQRRQAAFLRLLADSGEVRAAAKASAVSHQTVYRLRRASPAFRRAWDAALLVAREHAEEVLASRAMHGVEEEVFYHGEVVAKRRRYDARLLLAHLARLDRLETREDVALLAGDFDALLGAFDRGDEAALEALDERARRAASGTGESGGEGGAHSAPGPCNMRSMAAAGEPKEDGEEEVLPELERRLRAMEAARPRHAKPLKELVMGEGDVGSVEAAQLEAFEDGEERWWALTSEDVEERLAEASASDQLEIDPGVAPADQADPLRSSAAEVDDAPAGEGAAVVDTNGDGAPVARVGDAHLAAKGEGAVRGSHRAHVEPLAVGGAAPVEAAPVIGGDPGAEIAQNVARLERGLESVEVDGVVGDAQVQTAEIGAERLDHLLEMGSEGDGTGGEAVSEASVGDVGVALEIGSSSADLGLVCGTGAGDGLSESRQRSHAQRAASKDHKSTARECERNHGATL